MRVRDHVLISTAGAVLLYPRLRGALLGPWAASILIDVDHYLWFCLRQRRLNPLAALRFFNQAQPPQHRQTRLLHSPAVLLVLLLRRRCTTAWALLGMAFHVGLDAYDTARRRRTCAAALARDGFTCQRCGARGPGVVTHLWHQPCLLPSYRPEHVTSLCGACHEVAHAARRAAAGPTAPPWVQQRPAGAHAGAPRRGASAAAVRAIAGAIREIGARFHG